MRSGKLKATGACLQILDEVQVDPPDSAQKKIDVSQRSIQVLHTFQSMHMSWFPNLDFLRHETEHSTANLYDANEMGYHLTYALFKKGEPYSAVVTRKDSFRGMRVSSVPATHIIDPSGVGYFERLNEKIWALEANEKDHREWHPRLIQFGLLVGISPMQAIENPIHLFDSNREVIATDISKSLGGGILGTRPYILLNSLQLGTSDGGLVSHRSWARALLSDLMCRNLPVLRESDVRDQVIKKSTIPFRKNDACMHCHASMDPIADTIRNQVEMRSAGWRDKHFSPRVLMSYEVDQPTIPRDGEPDGDFYLRPPEGRVFYRSYNGQLINRKVTGVQEFGEALAQTDDLYLCAASRYFEFMTGVHVQMGDFTVPPLKTVDSNLLPYREFVIQQGLELKRHQSLKRLVGAILNSPFYHDKDYRGLL